MEVIPQGVKLVVVVFLVLKSGSKEAQTTCHGF